MPESKVSDSSEDAIVPRKRGRPPKSKNSLLNCPFDDNKLENASEELIELQENDVPQESKTSSMNNVLNDKMFDDTSENLSTPQKKDRLPKLSSENTTLNDKNVDDISAELAIPRKRGRGRPRKSNPLSLTIPSGDEIANDASEIIDSLQTESDPSNSMSLSQNSISDDQDIDVIEELVDPPKRGRGRPRKPKSTSSLNISSTVETTDDASKDIDIVEISKSSCELSSSPQTPTSSDKKFGNVSEKSITAQKRSRPSKPKCASVDTLKRSNKLSKSKSSSIDISNKDKTSNITLVVSTISGKTVKQSSKQLKLDFSTLAKSPKNADFPPKIDNKSSESETGELKFYPIFTSPSSFNKNKNIINQETKLNTSNSYHTKINSDLNENEIKIVETDEINSLNDIHSATDIDSSKISDLNNSTEHNIELSVCDMEQVCSNVQEDSGPDSIKVVDQINVSDKKPKNSKVKLKQKNENKQKTLLEINSDVSNTKIQRKDSPRNIENEIDCSAINDTLSRHSLEIEITNSPKIEGESKNAKEKIKLSLIFTSNEALSVQVNAVNHSNKKIMNSDSQLQMNKTVISRKSETVTLNNSPATIEIEVLKESCDSDRSKKSERVVPGDSSTSDEIETTELCKSDVSLKPEKVVLSDSSTTNEIEETDLCKSDVSKNSETVVLSDSSSSMEIEVSKETEVCESKANDVDPHVSDSVQEVCLKDQKSDDCDVIEISDSIDQKDISNEHAKNLNLEVLESVDYDIIEMTDISNENTENVNLENNSDSIPKLKQEKRKKKTKSDKINRKSELVESASDTEGSSRRRSLRCRNARDVFLSYSELDCDADSSESSKSDKHRMSKNAKGKNNNCVNGNLSKHSLEVDYIDLSEVQEKSKNKKKNDKLFPIFKSNKASSDETNVSSPSNKRKSLCDVLVDNNASEKYHKAKKVRSQVNNLTENSSLNSQRNQKCNKETDNFIDLEGNKDFTKQTENDSISVSKKSYKIDTEIICFPKLSHVNVHTETQPDKISNFLIVDEEVDSHIIVPLWNENENIIDVNCTEVIKSLEADSHVCKESENNVIEASSSMDKSNENDVLWTDSIQNTVSKGKENENLVNEVKLWLLQWRNRFSKSSKPRRHSHDSDSYSSDSDSDDDFISNSIILYGMSGSGKTSLVFSLAEELGFTVLEVNASSHRSGRNISNQLKEALESYHMEGIKIEDALENSKSETKKQTKRKRLSDEPENSQAKNIKSFFEVGSKETEKKNKSSKKKNITNFFVADDSKKDKNKGKNKKTKETSKKNESAENSNDYFEKINTDKKSCRISSSTIILFDDVDIVFEEDEGFWSTVKGFLKISKKPVIFTVSRNLPIVKNTINADIQIFNMMPASKDTALETLKTCCKMYLRENTNIDLELLTSPSPTDLRRSILNTQFWSKTAKFFEDRSSSAPNNSHENHSKLVCFNNFIAGDLNFSAKHVRELLFNHLPNYPLKTVSDYHRLGYDILFNNYFSILDILDSIKHEKVWKTVSDQNSCNVTKSFSDSQMWEEACEIFKQKKKALKSGSCSKDLFVISEMVDDFSFADMLKGLSPNKNQCISASERIKLWTAGLPICNDHVLLSYEDILQVISLIHIYALRKAQKEFVSGKISNDSILVLEHPFTVYDKSFSSKTENDLLCISEALPASQQMNKTALALDYLSMIKNICKDEESRQTNSGKRSGRFLHYFDSISFLIDRKVF